MRCAAWACVASVSGCVQQSDTTLSDRNVEELHQLRKENRALRRDAKQQGAELQMAQEELKDLHTRERKLSAALSKERRENRHMRDQVETIGRAIQERDAYKAQLDALKKK
jgi:septal ring factor EnvC (AmiA/AmiB activator)